MTKRAFGDLEQSILNILQSEARMTVREIQYVLGDQDKYTTIMTVMARLVEKKMLAREKVGKRHEYWILKNDKNSLFQRLRSRLFSLKTVDMVSYLIDEAEDLSAEDLDKVEEMIQAAKRKRKLDE